jgi:prophage antirepressor-like protein
MSKYDAMSTDELGCYLSDYYKDTYGYRPRYEGLYSNREAMIGMIESVDQYQEMMRSTFAGREELRCQGWLVDETDPELQKQAQWLADERARREAELEAQWYHNCEQKVVDQEMWLDKLDAEFGGC